MLLLNVAAYHALFVTTNDEGNLFNRVWFAVAVVFAFKVSQRVCSELSKNIGDSVSFGDAAVYAQCDVPVNAISKIWYVSTRLETRIKEITAHASPSDRNRNGKCKRKVVKPLAEMTAGYLTIQRYLCKHVL